MTIFLTILITLIVAGIAYIAFASGVKDDEGWGEFNGLKFRNFLKDKK